MHKPRDKSRLQSTTYDATAEGFGQAKVRGGCQSEKCDAACHDIGGSRKAAKYFCGIVPRKETLLWHLLEHVFLASDSSNWLSE